MSNPFDYVTSINKTKNNMMRDTDNDTLAEKDYQPFLVNLAMSYFPDTLLHSNFMNTFHELDNRPQYEFYLNSVRQRSRYSKWAKKVDNPDLDIICNYYKCNISRARDYLTILSTYQLNMIKKELEKGGTNNESSRTNGGNNTT